MVIDIESQQIDRFPVIWKANSKIERNLSKVNCGSSGLKPPEKWGHVIAWAGFNLDQSNVSLG